VRDRFPLVLVGGLVVLALLGSFLLKGARRGAFADTLSTFRSEPDGARALYLVLEAQHLPVTRNQHSLDIIDPGLGLVLLGTRFTEGGGPEQSVAFDGSDAGVSTDDEDFNDFKERGLSALSSTAVNKDEREQLLEHVRNGATLVYVPGSWHGNALLTALNVGLVRADPKLDVRTLVPAQPSAFTRGVEKLEAKVAAFLTLPSTAVPLVLDDQLGKPVAALVPWGQGQVIIVSAPDLAMNRRLAVADNARFWSSLVGALGTTHPIAFDEYHHGFTGERSMGEFAARYGLSYAIAQLLLGVALWALALKRFGRPRTPPREIRVGSTDALFATSRVYREGKHHAHAAAAITRELAATLATRAGLNSRSTPTEVSAALDARGRKDLARALLDVARHAAGALTDDDVQTVARLAALTRRTLHQQPRTS
jgi:hypothetical protein